MEDFFLRKVHWYSLHLRPQESVARIQVELARVGGFRGSSRSRAGVLFLLF